MLVNNSAVFPITPPPSQYLILFPLFLLFPARAPPLGEMRRVPLCASTMWFPTVSGNSTNDNQDVRLRRQQPSCRWKTLLNELVEKLTFHSPNLNAGVNGSEIEWMNYQKKKSELKFVIFYEFGSNYLMSTEKLLKSTSTALSDVIQRENLNNWIPNVILQCSIRKGANLWNVQQFSPNKIRFNNELKKEKCVTYNLSRCLQ